MPAQLGQRIAVASFGRDVDGVNNGLARKRLSQQGDDAEVERSTNVLGVGEAGHEDHLGRQRAAERRTDRKTIGRRHDQIQQNNIGVVDRRRIERLAP